MAKLPTKHVCSAHGAQTETGQTKLGAITHILLECGCTLEAIDDTYVSAGDAVLHGEELYRVDASEDGVVTISNVNGVKNVMIELVTYIAKDTLSAPKKNLRIMSGAEVRHKENGLVGTVSHRDAHGRWMVVVWDSHALKQKKFVWYPNELEVLKEASSHSRAYIPRSEYVPSPAQARRSGGSYGTSTPKKKTKSHSISTADLIKEEVSDLRKQQQGPVKLKPVSKPAEKKEEDPVEKVKPKKRKGVW
jgi:hypothetical protein